VSIEAQTTIILDAMGLNTPEVSGPSKMRAVAAMIEELTRQLHQAIREGRQPQSMAEAFREGRWPSRKALYAKVQEIDAKAKAMAGAA
jgi:DNA invertase Pin-like site-specific DNA recombinase